VAGDGLGGDVDLVLTGSLEFDGFVAYTMAVTARTETQIADIRLELPYARGAATYLMGLGQRAGRGRRDSTGRGTSPRATRTGRGSAASTRDSSSRCVPTTTCGRSTRTSTPEAAPPAAVVGNAGRGGISIGERGDTVRVTAYSGHRTMKAGETLRFDVNLIVTPFHALDTDFQWRTRFYTATPRGRDRGHRCHGRQRAPRHPGQPWINYPFIAHREMRAYVDEAHRKGLKVKIYNTVRELSNRAYELFPLRSLGYEVFPPGAGGGFSWLQEHLGGTTSRHGSSRRSRTPPSSTAA